MWNEVKNNYSKGQIKKFLVEWGISFVVASIFALIAVIIAVHWGYATIK